MTSTSGWKFVLSSVIALAGVVLPIVLWLVDHSSKSIAISVVSSTSLDPTINQPVEGLAFTLDGVALRSPYLSVLHIQNTGTKPVSSSEFESPIEIKSESKSKIVRAEFADASPIDLQPVITVVKNRILVDPLLLNPGDSLKLNVVTSEDRPAFIARSRVAGISQIPVSEKKIKDVASVSWLSDLVGVVLLIIYIAQFLRVVDVYYDRSVIQLWTSFTALASLVGGVLLLINSARVSDNKILALYTSTALVIGVLTDKLRNRGRLKDAH